MSDALPQPWTKLSTAFKETPKGPTFYDFNDRRVVILRAEPIAAWRIPFTTKRLRGVRYVDVDVAALIREVRAMEAESRGEVTGIALRDSPYRNRRRTNFAAWLAHIPRPVQDLAGDGWSGETWSYLRFLATSPRAREIATSPGGAPFVLALSLADRFMEAPPRRFWPFVDGLLKRKRKEALGQLGFPPLPSSVAMLDKVPRAQVSIATLQELKRVLLDPECAKRCFHAERLSAALLAMLDSSLLPQLAPSLLEELASLDLVDVEATGLRQRFNHTIEMTRQLGRSIGVIQSVRELSAAHRDCVNALQAEAPPWAQQVGPIPGVFPELRVRKDLREQMEPLATFEALRAEGTEMEHCLGVVGHQIAAALDGRFIAYAVRASERATLAVWRPSRHEAWEVYDVRGTQNAPVSDWLHELAGRVVDAMERDRLRRGQLTLWELIPSEDASEDAAEPASTTPCT